MAASDREYEAIRSASSPATANTYGRVTQREDGVGTTSYVYNANDGETLGAGQVARINGPFPDDTLEYTYDELGRVGLMQIVDDATHTTATYSEAYDFDVRGRVTEVTNDLGVFEYAYVGQTGRVSGVDYPNGMTAVYDYWGTTGDHLLKQLKYLSAGGPPELLAQFDYTYAQDRTISTWRQELQGAGVKTWTFGYDGAMQLVEAVAEDGSEDVIEHERYGHDKAGNRIQVVTGTTTSPEVRNYKVNNLNQLVSERGFGRTLFSGEVDEPATVTVNGQPAKVMSTEGDAPYRFEAWVQLPAGTSEVEISATDGNSNTTTETYEVTTTGTTALFSYDLEGNMTFEREPNTDPKWEYRWDQEARLVRAVWGDRETVFEYDGETRRVRIRELDDEVETAEHVYIWCGGRICQKREDDGETVVRNYFDEGFTEDGAAYVHTKDHLQSIWQVVEDDGETVTSLTSYSPWGEQTLSGAGPHSSFGYTGHLRYHEPRELELAQHRGYDPRLGRWLNRDPIGEGGGINLHGYVLNGPSYLLDPDGMSPTPGGGSPLGMGGTIVGNPPALNPISALAQALALAAAVAYEILRDKPEMGPFPTPPTSPPAPRPRNPPEPSPARPSPPRGPGKPDAICRDKKPDDPGACKEFFKRCMDDPWQPEWNRGDFGPKKPCLDCLTICKISGIWPLKKCPDEHHSP